MIKIENEKEFIALLKLCDNRFSTESILEKAIEELDELKNEIVKILTNSYTIDTNRLKDKVADVWIMVNQLATIFPLKINEIVQIKINRQVKRMEKYTIAIDENKWRETL